MVLYANISCALPRDMAHVKPLTRLVFIEAVLYCRENLTDGLIERRVLPFIAVGVPHKTRHFDALTAADFLEQVPVGWQIPLDVWCEWNPLRAQVDELRRAEAERKADYRERKRRESQRDKSGTGASVPVGQAGTVPDTRKQPEPKPEPERKPESKLRGSSSVLTVVPDHPGKDDDDEFEYVVGQIVAAKELEYRPRKPRAWRLATRRNTISEDGELIRRMLDDRTQPDQVALFVLGHGDSTAQDRSEQPQCPATCECGGEGYIGTTDERGVHRLAPCPGRTA